VPPGGAFPADLACRLPRRVEKRPGIALGIACPKNSIPGHQ
jgi:hypothetical protein